MFLVRQAEEIGLEYQIVEPVMNKPTVLMCWRGSNGALPCVVLNSHYDVVPVMREKWDVDPFGGEVGENGEIYGRGAQDMKSVCIQYLQAIRRLKKTGFVPLRTIWLTYVPDEVSTARLSQKCTEVIGLT